MIKHIIILVCTRLPTLMFLDCTGYILCTTDQCCVTANHILLFTPIIINAETVYGSTYSQDHTIGCESYHFVEEGRCYISYAAVQNQKLDNGLPIPETKDFEHTSFDLQTRTFRGIVDWSPHTRNGNSKCEYQMVFSEDFTQIENGEVVQYDGEGTKRDNSLIYGEDLFYMKYNGQCLLNQLDLHNNIIIEVVLVIVIHFLISSVGIL